MPTLPAGLAPIVSALCFGLAFAACSASGDAPDPPAPVEAILTSPGSLAAVAAIGPTRPVGTADSSSAPTSAMVGLRSRHTASLLANGQVLAAGGTDGTAPLARAELFNPATSTWTGTASMTQAREQHAAVVLTDGKVLVTGGLGASGALTGVELYDPQTSLWTARAPMAQARARHTMTRLSSGNVLVLGGTDGATALASGELYDPVADTWMPIAPLHQARALHTTTLLADGRVLVVGGSDGASASLATIEILGAAKGTWSFGAPLATARRRHTATLLADGSLLVAGGVGAAGILADAASYSPLTDLWTPAGAMAEARADHSALVTPLGHLVVAGGQGISGPLATAEGYQRYARVLFDHSRYVPNPWFSLGSMSAARAEHTVTLLGNGLSLHAGGAASATSELFDDAPGILGTTCSQDAQCASGFCANNVCCSTACTPECMGSDATGACVNVEGFCYGAVTTNSAGPAGTCVAGGCMTSIAGFNHCGQFGNVPCGNNSALPDAIGCYSHADPNGSLPPAQFPAGQLCTIIGPPGPCNCVDGNLASIGKLDPVGHPCATTADCGADVCVFGFCLPACAGPTCWLSDTHFTPARLDHTATLLPDGKVLFAGGRDTSMVNTIVGGLTYVTTGVVFDPATSSWTAAYMTSAHHGHTATLLPSGEVLVLGGARPDVNIGVLVDVPETVSERYTPATGTWAATGPLLAARKYHTATLLPSGQVLVLGGVGKNQSFVDAPLSSAELYDPATGTSTIAAPMPISRSHHTASLLASGRVLAIGGTSSTEVDSYDPATDTWSPVAPLPSPRSLHTATTLENGAILVTGGDLGQPGTSALLYDPLADTWTPAASMQGARAGHAAAIVSNGDVIVAGGGADAERYTPLTDTWAPFGSMLAKGRHGNTATLLADGRLLVGFGLATGDDVWATVNIELASTLGPLCAGVVCPVPDLCHDPSSCDPQTGQCPAFSPKSCPAVDECTTTTCDLATGACAGPIASLPDGTACTAGTCQSGACTPTAGTTASSSASSSVGVGGAAAASSSGSGAGGSGGTAGVDSSTSTGVVATTTTGSGGAAASSSTGEPSIVAGGGCALQPEREPAEAAAWLALGLLTLAAGRRRRPSRRDVTIAEE